MTQTIFPTENSPDSMDRIWSKLTHFGVLALPPWSVSTLQLPRLAFSIYIIIVCLHHDQACGSLVWFLKICPTNVNTVVPSDTAASVTETGSPAFLVSLLFSPPGPLLQGPGPTARAGSWICSATHRTQVPRPAFLE